MRGGPVLLCVALLHDEGDLEEVGLDHVHEVLPGLLLRHDLRDEVLAGGARVRDLHAGELGLEAVLEDLLGVVVVHRGVDRDRPLGLGELIAF